MILTPFNEKTGTQHAEAVTYAEASLAGQVVPLVTDVFLPKRGAKSVPLLVWLGADMLSERAGKPAGPRRLAEILTRHGVALAAPTVRVGAARADLPNTVVERLARIEPQRDKTVEGPLSTFPAIAATQDLCALLTWVERNAQAFGLSGKTVLAGASVGAGLAFNLAVAAPHLGLSRPSPLGILSYSGACPWPSLYVPNQMRIFALHNPTDHRVPIHPVRQMAQSDPRMEFIESVEQAHGSLGLWPQEPSADACNRILTRVKTWCAT